MAILTLTSADAGKTIPVSGSLDWDVYGTDAADTIEVAAGASAIVRGGAGTDVVKLLGGSADYTVKLSGSNVVFTHTSTGKTVTVPVTSAGDSVSFGNGTAVTLKSTGSVVTLGAQTISATDAAVTGATGTATGATTGTTAGQSFSLTTSAETKALTTGNDTVDGTVANSLEGDTIIDQGGVDTLNAKLTAALTNATTIADVENINLEWDAFGTATVDAAKITNATITVTSAKLGYLGDVQINNAGANKIVAGSGAAGALDVNGSTTAVVDAGTAKTVTVDALASKGVSANVTAGAATTSISVGAAGATNTFATVDVVGGAATTAIRVDGTTGTADVANVSVVKDSTVSFLTNKVETVNLTAAAGQKVTIDDVSLFDKLTVTSAGAVTLIAGSDELNAKTLTNATTGLTIDLTSDAAADLTKVQASNINLKNNLAGDLKVASGAVLTLGVAQNGTGEILSGTGTTDAVTLNVTVDQTKIDVIDGTDDIETVTINTALAATDADSVLTIGQLDAKNAVIAGADKVTLTKFNATSIDASAVTKDFTATQDAKAATTVVGSATAKNTIEFKADAQDTAYTGGEGVDVVKLAQTTGNSTTILGNGANTYTNTTLTNGTAVVIGGTGVDTITVTTAATADTANVVIQSGDGNDVVTLALTGAGNKETATVELGAGDDKITLGSATSATDVLSITGGDGTDTVDLNGKNISAGTITLTTVEVLHDSIGAATVDAALLGGKTFTIKGDGSLATQLDVVTGTAGSYDFSGLVLDQSLTAGIGGLSIIGNAGNDTIVGTSGNDTIATNGGTDVITGGAGADAITLGVGAGNDKVIIGAGHTGKTTGTVDLISAFKTAGADTISFGLAATATNYVEAASTFNTKTGAVATIEQVTAQANDILNGTVRFAVLDNANGDGSSADIAATNSYVFFDRDGDGTADEVITLVGKVLTNVEFADFVA